VGEVCNIRVILGDFMADEEDGKETDWHDDVDKELDELIHRMHALRHCVDCAMEKLMAVE